MMIDADLPLWLTTLIALCLLVGAALSLTGSIGLLRLKTFFERIHSPTLATSYGTAGVVLASILYFSALQSRLVVHELLIGLFVTLTTPVTLMVLARAVLHRDRYGDKTRAPGDERRSTTKR